MGWKIVRDYLNEQIIRDYGRSSNESLVGEERDYKGEGEIKVRVYDGDGILYFEAVCDCDGSAEAFHDWARADSGTVSSKITDGEGRWTDFM